MAPKKRVTSADHPPAGESRHASDPRAIDKAHSIRSLMCPRISQGARLLSDTLSAPKASGASRTAFPVR
jgi:hypothetical protein